MSASTVSGDSLLLLEERLEVTKKAKRKFDPATIQAIIAAILLALQTCNRLGNRVRLRRRQICAAVAWAIYDQVAGGTLMECFEHADDVFALADEATDLELIALIAEALG